MADLRIVASGSRRASSTEKDAHELYLMCDDVEAFVAEMNTDNIACSPVQNQGRGLLTRMTLRAADSSVSISRGTHGRRLWTDG